MIWSSAGGGIIVLKHRAWHQVTFLGTRCGHTRREGNKEKVGEGRAEADQEPPRPVPVSRVPRQKEERHLEEAAQRRVCVCVASGSRSRVGPGDPRQAPRLPAPRFPVGRIGAESHNTCLMACDEGAAHRVCRAGPEVRGLCQVPGECLAGTLRSRFLEMC